MTAQRAMRVAQELYEGINVGQEGNLVEPAKSPPPPDPVTPADLQRAGIDPSAAAAIGLYQDNWRRQLPVDLIRSLRHPQ